MRRRAGRSFSGASTSWPSHRGRAKGNRVGIADPIAIVLPMAATSSVVAYGQICKRQSDLVLLLFLLLGGHDLVSLMNSRPKTPRLARPYYKHLVNEWKLNKSGDGAVQRERAGRAAPPARRPSPGWTSRDWRPIRRGDRSPHQYTGRSPPAIAAGARLTKSRPAWACANAGRPHRHRRPETHRGWPPWRSERRGGRWSANNRRGF